MSIRERWAFLVGINSYVDYGSLSYCVDDVLALEKLLTAAKYTVVCLHDRHDWKNSDGSLNRFYPNAANIRRQFERLCSTIQTNEEGREEDLLLVYFACHGTTHLGQPRLIASDTEETSLEKAISITELEQEMDSSGAGCKVLMLDACHIGLGKANSRAPANFDLLRKIHDQAKGYALLSASTDQQKAYEWEGAKHGVFSYYVLSGLSGEADLHDKNYVTVGDLSGHILNELQKWCAKNGVNQAPQSLTEGLGDFVLIDKYKSLAQSISVPNIESESGQPGQGLKSRGRSPAQVIEALWSLDCAPQCQAFKAGTPRSRRAAAFVVQAKDSRIQHWLVKRLVNQIPDVANASVFPFVVPTHPMWKRRDLGELWLDLARKLQCQADPTTVIENLVQIYRTKPIIIAMYGWLSMNRSQALQQQVLTDLWQPLVEAVGSLDGPPLRSRIILFLAEGTTLAAPSPIESPPHLDPIVPIRLEPLTEITNDHIADWMESDRVYPKLSQLIPPAEIGTLIDKEILEWERDPAAAIEQICYIFELENGIADIEAEWRLAG